MAATSPSVPLEGRRVLSLGSLTKWLGVLPFFAFILAFQLLPSVNRG